MESVMVHPFLMEKAVSKLMTMAVPSAGTLLHVTGVDGQERSTVPMSVKDVTTMARMKAAVKTKPAFSEDVVMNLDPCFLDENGISTFGFSLK